jgi:hypothetical protein
MSALGHRRTYAVQNGMSAFPPKADIKRDVWNVRYGQRTLGSPRPKGRFKIRWVKLSVVFFRDMLAKAPDR